MTIEPELRQLAERVAELRQDRGWTFDDLAKRSGVSKPYLSRLEAGDRQPSLATLISLAAAFGVQTSSLLESKSAEHAIVVRRDEFEEHKANGLLLRPLSTGTQPGMQPLEVRVPAKRVASRLVTHRGEEWLHVQSGTLCLTVGEETWTLEPGDSAHFDASLPHGLAAEDSEVRLLMVISTQTPDHGAPHTRTK